MKRAKPCKDICRWLCPLVYPCQSCPVLRDTRARAHLSRPIEDNRELEMLASHALPNGRPEHKELSNINDLEGRTIR